MSAAFEKEYQWYLLGCRLLEQRPLNREEFETQYAMLSLLGPMVSERLKNRTPAEWELDREDADWTNVLQRLANLNIAFETSDLITAIQAGRNADEDGDAGAAGILAFIPPRRPILVGAGAKLNPALDPEPQWRDP